MLVAPVVQAAVKQAQVQLELAVQRDVDDRLDTLGHGAVLHVPNLRVAGHVDGVEHAQRIQEVVHRAVLGARHTDVYVVKLLFATNHDVTDIAAEHPKVERKAQVDNAILHWLNFGPLF